jgi:hypothetical protein
VIIKVDFGGLIHDKFEAVGKDVFESVIFIIVFNFSGKISDFMRLLVFVRFEGSI